MYLTLLFCRQYIFVLYNNRSVWSWKTINLDFLKIFSVGFEPRTSRSSVERATTRPTRPVVLYSSIVKTPGQLFYFTIFFLFQARIIFILLEPKVIIVFVTSIYPANTSVQSDQALYCWLTIFKFSSWHKKIISTNHCTLCASSAPLHEKTYTVQWNNDNAHFKSYSCRPSFISIDIYFFLTCQPWTCSF